jgi:hypothetical protein
MRPSGSQPALKLQVRQYVRDMTAGPPAGHGQTRPQVQLDDVWPRAAADSPVRADVWPAQVIQKMAKQRKDSIESYQKGGREDLVAKEQVC